MPDPWLPVIITGGQTGVDQAGWRAAKAAGLEIAGWLMPKGFLTEDGPRLEFADLYNARECGSADYAVRTGFNVEYSDHVLWLGDATSPGGRATLAAASRRNRPVTIVGPGNPATTPGAVAAKLLKSRPEVLLIAGNRESKAPGIGARAEAYLDRLFEILKRGGQA
jgi:hypothetical protein